MVPAIVRGRLVVLFLPGLPHLNGRASELIREGWRDLGRLAIAAVIMGTLVFGNGSRSALAPNDTWSPNEHATDVMIRRPVPYQDAQQSQRGRRGIAIERERLADVPTEKTCGRPPRAQRGT
jgi:hypothetical protein